MILLAAIVAVTNAFGTVSVDTHGARVVSYVPTGGEEVFFASRTGTGGMPLCWPWFAEIGTAGGARRHGVARYHDFEVASASNREPCDSEIVLRLVSNADTRREFPHDFVLTVTIRLADRLSVSMTAENAGDEPFSVTEAFHPYFAVADSEKCRVEGLGASVCRLTDPVAGRAILLGCDGGGRRVWRPNAESHLSRSVSSILPGDWKLFVCVESGTFSGDAAYWLEPGGSHAISCTICVDRQEADCASVTTGRRERCAPRCARRPGS